MPQKENDKLAVLIDADNAQASIVVELLEEIAKFGIASIKRAYGDWTTTRLKGWKEHLHLHAIQPIQQFSYTDGKNATDASLIIDAMDILHGGHVDGFCIVSSDSDFTRLATRIRENGLSVYGFGEQKTPQAFTSACDKFIFTENLRSNNDAKNGDTVKSKSEKQELKRILTRAIDVVADDDGWASLSAVASYIDKNIPSFDSRTYGFSRFGKMVKALDYIDIEERRALSGSTNVHIFIRIQGRWN